MVSRNSRHAREVLKGSIALVLVLLGECAWGDGPVWPLPDSVAMANPRIPQTFGEFQQGGTGDGEDGSYLHDGLDIAASEGSFVVAICSGTITEVGGAFYMMDEVTISPSHTPTGVGPGYDQSLNVSDTDGEWSYGHMSYDFLQNRFALDTEDIWQLGGRLAAVGDTLGQLWPAGWATHLHLRREIPGPGRKTVNPLPILASLVASDTRPPSFVGRITLDSDETGAGGVFDSIKVSGQPEPVQLVHGKADVVACIRDWYNDPPDSMTWWPVGAQGVGYGVSGPNGESFGPFVREFTAPLPHFPQEASLSRDLACTLYRNTPSLDSKSDSAFYVVSNYHTDLGEDNWTSEARKACWNTRMEQGGGLPWNAPNASHPDEAEFEDGLHTVTVQASDHWQTTEASIPVIVDNWAPYVKEVLVWKDGEGGEPEEPDSLDWVIYHGRWEYDQTAGHNALHVLHQEASPDAVVHIQLIFSEDMDMDGGPAVYLQREVEPHSTQVFEGEWTSSTVWQGETMASPPGGVDPEEVLLGRYVVEVYARDLAGNSLDGTPVSVASRDAAGTWAEPGYDPEGAHPDVNHTIVVASALWVVENADGGTRVRGLGQDGGLGRDVTAGLSGLAPVSCAGDPVTGGCWILGTTGENGYLGKTGARGEVEISGVGTVGWPLWAGADYHDGGVWTLSEAWIEGGGGGGTLCTIVGKHGGDGVELDTLLVEGSCGPASVDQATGGLWALFWDDDEIQLHAIRVDTTIVSGQESYDVTSSGSSYVGSSSWCVWIDIGAIPGTGEVWIAGIWVEPGPSSTRLKVQQWGLDGAVGTPVVNEVAGYAGDGTCESGSKAFTGVVTDAVTGAGIWVWMTSTLTDVVPPPCGSTKDGVRPVGDPIYEATDLLGAAGGGDSGHSIALPGCTTACGDEYVDSRLMAASPRLGGVWWMRPHLVPGGGTSCMEATGQTYTAMFYQVTGEGQEQVVFERAYANVECPDPFGEGIVQISACAGATWGWDIPTARPVVVDQVAAGAQTGAPEAFEYRLGTVSPNPCSGCEGVTVRYSLAGSSLPQFAVYDLAGRRLRTLVLGMRPAGEYAVRWDMLDFGGKRVPPATYILQMRTEGFVGRTPLVVIR